MEVNKLRQMLDAQKKTMKQMQGMSEADMQRMQANLQNGRMPQNMGGFSGGSKGKGKGKGQGKIFR